MRIAFLLLAATMTWNGEAIAPGLRSNVYVVQKLEPGWRITAFYARDMDKGIDCAQRSTTPR